MNKKTIFKRVALAVAAVSAVVLGGIWMAGRNRRIR